LTPKPGIREQNRHKAADVIENSSGSLLELKQPLTRMSLLRARPDEFRGSFLPLKINAGGNRARARQSRVVEICLDTLTNLTRSPWWRVRRIERRCGRCRNSGLG